VKFVTPKNGDAVAVVARSVEGDAEEENSDDSARIDESGTDPQES